VKLHFDIVYLWVKISNSATASTINDFTSFSSTSFEFFPLNVFLAHRMFAVSYCNFQQNFIHLQCSQYRAIWAKKSPCEGWLRFSLVKSEFQVAL